LRASARPGPFPGEIGKQVGYLNIIQILHDGVGIALSVAPTSEKNGAPNLEIALFGDYY
jgi:hypothetical protein